MVTTHSALWQVVEPNIVTQLDNIAPRKITELFEICKRETHGTSTVEISDYNPASEQIAESVTHHLLL